MLNMLIECLPWPLRAGVACLLLPFAFILDIMRYFLGRGLFFKLAVAFILFMLGALWAAGPQHFTSDELTDFWYHSISYRVATSMVSSETVKFAQAVAGKVSVMFRLGEAVLGASAASLESFALWI